MPSLGICSTRRSVKAQTNASTRSGEYPALARSKSVVKAHIVFERRERADMMNPALLVERSDGFRSDDLPARRPHRRITHIGIDHLDGGFHHVAAIVDLGDDAIGLVL